ncbi:MAG TPA: sigma-70 family RNA polymerase sigma factor [Solirubrobacteraceae bacterium]|jgi:RNA polymerase sigma factor (sigma-70 family)|nr:sigma-70 family RNA polymerase sigma factor [Solirubrobacteraceae bacterium]
MTRGEPLRGELEAVYRRRYRPFLRVAAAIVGNEASGHDAVQEGFAQALRAQQSFRSEGSVEGWVWRMVVNEALASRRRQVARREAPEAIGAGSANGHVADEAGVRAWVAALPERQRLAVYLRYYADLDYRSIADALGVEVGTVSASLSSAHQALRRSLEEVER